MVISDSIRDIRCFVAVYEERSFTAAAEREGATQSGVSQHIRKLEDRAAVQLFRRGGAAVSPTPAADQYYRHCVELLRRHDAADQALRTFERGLEGEVVAGLMPTMTCRTLAPAMMRFMELHPNVIVRCEEAYSAALTQRVQAGELDFAIVPAMATSIGLRSRQFLRTPEVLVAGPAAGLQAGNGGALSSLGPFKLVVPSLRNARRLTLEAYLASNGARVSRMLELDSMLGTLDLVATTDWFAILPALMIAGGQHASALTVQALRAPPLWLDLIVIEPSRQSLSPAATAFLDVLARESLLRAGDVDEATQLP